MKLAALLAVLLMPATLVAQDAPDPVETAAMLVIAGIIAGITGIILATQS